MGFRLERPDRSHGCFQPVVNHFNAGCGRAIKKAPEGAGGVGQWPAPREPAPSQPGSGRRRLRGLGHAAQGEIDAAAVVDLTHTHRHVVAHLDHVFHLLHARF